MHVTVSGIEANLGNNGIVLYIADEAGSTWESSGSGRPPSSGARAMGGQNHRTAQGGQNPSTTTHGELSLDNGAGAGTFQATGLLLAHEKFEEITASHDYKELLHGARNP